MFAKTIIDSDPFTEMPLSSQALYFHLGMRADDDGFLNNPKKICREIGASYDDLKILIAKRFVLEFESGVVVIKHWRMQNSIRADRYKPTLCENEKSLLELKENGAYTERRPYGNHLATAWQPDGNQSATVSPQYSIGEDSIGKGSIDTRSNIHTYTHAREAELREYQQSLCGDVVRMSFDEFADLFERMDGDDLGHYVDVVARSETEGRHYSRSHYDAIRDMAIADGRWYTYAE